MNVGENVKRLRLAAGLSQTELAQKVSVSIPMICQIERGTKAPSLQLAMEIAAVLGCDVQELAEGA